MYLFRLADNLQWKSISRQVLVGTVLGLVAGQAKSLVREELVGARVDGSTDSDARK